jgi:hypothetical protein
MGLVFPASRERVRPVRPSAGPPARCRGAVAAAAAGLGLASCSSMSTPSMPGFDSLKPKPTTTLLLIESNPAGAVAKTSLGPSCNTPCTLKIGSGSDFTVTFTLDGYVPQTLTVHSTMSRGDWSTGPSPVLEPGSLFPTLERAKPPSTVARKPSRPPA